MSVMLIPVNMVANVMIWLAPSDVNVYLGLLELTVKLTLMIVFTILVETGAVVLIRLMISNVSVSLLIVVKHVRVRWTPVLLTLASMEEPALHMETTRSTHALVLLDSRVQDVKWILMNVQLRCLVEMELPVLIRMEVILVNVRKDLKDEIVLLTLMIVVLILVLMVVLVLTKLEIIVVFVWLVLQAKTVMKTLMNVLQIHVRMEPNVPTMLTPSPAPVDLDFLVLTVRTMMMIVQVVPV